MPYLEKQNNRVDDRWIERGRALPQMHDAMYVHIYLYEFIRAMI